ncbi:hypothetical protein QC760_008149 [Botrytis cinerea]
MCIQSIIRQETTLDLVFADPPIAFIIDPRLSLRNPILRPASTNQSVPSNHPPPHRFLSKCIKKREANASHQGVAPPHIPAANLPRTAMLRVQSIPLTCFSSSIPLAFTHPPALRASNPRWEMLLGYHA